MPVCVGLGDAYSGGKVWAIHPYGNDHCCHLKKLRAEHCTEMQKQHSYYAACVHLSQGISRGPASTMSDLLSHRKKTTPRPSRTPCCDLGYCPEAARGTQEFIGKIPFCQELVLYHTKRRGKQLSRFTSFLPESTIFICFLRDP